MGVGFKMNIGLVVAFIVLFAQAHGDQTVETKTESGWTVSSENRDEIEGSATEESEIDHFSYTQEELNRYNEELNGILNEKLKNYTDLKIIPNYYGPTTHVRADVEIREILEISEVNMQMKLNLVMDIWWSDPHLMFEHVKIDDRNFGNAGLWVGNLVKEKIWMPTLSILNEKESSGHSKAFEEDSLFWRPSGALLRRINMVTTVSCSMSLEDFPMDEQNCSILIGSPNYLDNELKLRIHPFLNPVFSNSAHNVKLLGWRVSSLVHTGEGSERTTFAVELLFQRYVGYYIIGTFFPSALIVFISWLTFWMPRDAAGERMALGVTCVLTITTLLISSQASSPKVSYVKAIDIYMGVCFTLVFTTLLQSTLIGYLLRKVRILKAMKKLEEVKNNVAPPRGFASTVRRVVAGGMEANEEPKIINFILRCDIWCRLMFPAMFMIFNAIYWIYFLPGSRFDTQKGWNFPESYANVSDSRVE